MTAPRNMPRTLRSQRLRSYLWDAAGGRCQMCGAELGEDWQADHIIPWSTTRRTNVHEMQALCKECNRRKGRQMVRIEPSNPLEHIIAGFRTGQRDAITTVVSRVFRSDPEAKTAIMLPTRYGKSDVMRVCAVYLKQTAAIATSLVLVPSTYLRTQMIDEGDWQKCLARSGMDPDGKKLAIEMETRPQRTADIAPNDEAFVVATIQLVKQHLTWFCQWVEHVKAQTGLPVMVQYDEAHTGSEDNSWGDTLNKLVEAGAVAVLYTATPIRSDGKPIPGFPYDTISSEQKTTTIVRKDKDRPTFRSIQTYTTTKTQIRLRTHHETTFRKAWDEPNSPLCKISRVALDVDVREILDGITRESRLSEMEETATRKYLGKILRDNDVLIKGAVQLLVEKLDLCRRIEPDAAALVFSGNDTDADLEQTANRHARQIRQAILRLRPTWKVVIATAVDPKDAEAKLLDFVKHGRGDVLIVKQMASLGLNCPRLKVCLDLSPIRTPAAFVQRVTRIATVWGQFTHAYYITPDDIMGRDLFRKFVTEEGGSPPVTDSQLIEEREIEVEDKPGAKIYVIDTSPGGVMDSNLQFVPAEENARLHAWYITIPELTQVVSPPELAQRIPTGWPPNWEKKVEATNVRAVAEPTPLRPSLNLTSGDDLQTLRESIKLKVGTLMGMIKGKFSLFIAEEIPQDWPEASHQVYRLLRERADLPPQAKPSLMRNLEELGRMEAAAIQLIKEVRSLVPS